MKIIAVGRNYVAHAQELNNPIPDTPIIFMKPDTALLKDGKPFYYPDFSNDIHYEAEIVLKIAKEGKHIPEKFASNYFEEVTIGIDFTARDIQQSCKQKGLPWELAKAFDGSAPIGKFIPKTTLGGDQAPILFRLDINQQTRQQGNSDQMYFSFAYLISFVSRYITLKKGDLLFTGTPAGVGKVQIGDHLEGYLMQEKLLDLHIR